MRRSHATTERGFTLAEIMVTTAIFAIIMIAALTVYDRSNKVFKSGTEAADLQQSTRIAFDKLTSDVRMAGFDYNRGGTPNGAVGATLWSPSTAYAVGVQVDPGNGMIYTCSTAGTSGASAPTWNLTVNAITSDGTGKWTTVLVNQFAQMDEQIEYAGKSAIVFRANFDYNTDPTHGNGLEDAEGYTPIDASTGTKIFPYVTTGNDEIIAYALRSADASKNTGSIAFYLDAAKPRATYPGGSAEARVTIGASQGVTGQSLSSTTCSGCGIDLTNNNPPYTLYRISVDDVMKGSMGTPVAENIRSMNFYYFTDANASTLLKNTDGTDIATTRDAGFASTDAHDAANNLTGAVGGDGQYDPANSATTNVGDRSLRSEIQSLRVQLVGMNASPDLSYANPTETLAAFKNYREYSLQAVIVPRNLGLTGFPEPTNSAPGKPIITGMCTGYCAAPAIAWQPPTTGGVVQKYVIAWDTSSSGCFCPPNNLTIVDPTTVTTVIPDLGGIDPSKTWYYKIQAINDSGSTWSDAYSVVPKNSTKPSPPTNVTATTATQTHAANPANTDYTVTLTWKSPTTNDASKATTTCTGTGCTADGSVIPSAENIKYIVYRGTSASFDPLSGQGVPILSYTSASQPVVASPGASATWADSPTTSAYPPGTCTQYYYRVEAADRCSTVGSYNVSGNTADAISNPAPAAPASAVAGQAYDAGVQAVAPTSFQVNLAASSCVPGSNCTVALGWNKVTQDVSGNAIGVDRYVIARYRKKVADPAYVLDPTYGSSGLYLLSGQSQVSGTTVSYTDNTGPASDSDGTLWYYEYKVAAADCRVGVRSAGVDYPVACLIAGVTFSASGTTGNGTAANPWIIGAGDVIAESGGVGITGIQYTILLNGVQQFQSSVLVTPTYNYTWPSGLSSGSTYEITALVKTASCNESFTMWATEETPASCAFQNVGEASLAQSTSGSQTTAQETYTITNGGQDTMTLAGHTIKINWVAPAAEAGDETMTQIDYGGSCTDSFSLSSTPVSRTMPACAGTLAKNASLAIKFSWQYKKTDSPPLTTTTGLQKICIAYTIPSEATTKFCNLVGQSVSTNNPNSCD